MRRALAHLTRHAAGGPRPLANTVGMLAHRGEGSYVVTGDGARLLDAVSGYGVASLGHSHPAWVNAITKQARELAVAPLHTQQLADYVAALASVLPTGLDQIALGSTGAEAVEMAIRLSQTATGKDGILTFVDGFHGKTAAVRYSGDPASPEAQRLSPPWHRWASFPACCHHDAADYAACEEPVDADIEEISSRDDLGGVGAVLLEPVLGTAGNLPPKGPFLAALRRLCDQRGWLLIFDESITGFGRLGQLFAADWFGVIPNILVLSKGLGGGFPLSAVAAGRELWAASAFRVASSTSSSYGGNPLACAAGMATLQIVTDTGFLAEVREVAAHAAGRLRALSAASSQLHAARGVGLMLGFDLIDPDRGQAATGDVCAEIVRRCRDRGLLLAAHVARVRLSPPLTISRAETDQLFDVLHDVLA